MGPLHKFRPAKLISDSFYGCWPRATYYILLIFGSELADFQAINCLNIVNMKHISKIAAMVGLLSGPAFALPESRDALAHACNNCTNASAEPYVLAPAPWDLKASVAYVVPMIGLNPDVPNKAFSPLERNSSYATSGQLLAGTGLMMIIRYKDSPVGPYDEFIVMPGLYNNPKDGLIPRLRISRIYVTHKYTTWNGRNSKLFQNTLDKGRLS